MMLKGNNVPDARGIYDRLLAGDKSVVFAGSETIRDYLCYVLGNGIQMDCIESGSTPDNSDCTYIINDITDSPTDILSSASYLLSDFIKILNTANIPTDRKIALWGGGSECERKLPLIQKYCAPVVIIDSFKDGALEGIPFVRPENIDLKDYFVIVTTTKFSGEVRRYLNEKGCVEGADYVFGSNPEFLNDNADMFIRVIKERPLRKISCKRPFDYVNVGVGGNLTHCCFQWLPVYVGNVLNDTNNNYDTVTSRIIRISFMNQTYAFCDSVCCPFMMQEREKLYLKEVDAKDDSIYLSEQKIVDVDLAFDNTCNLYCGSCRENIVVDKGKENEVIAGKICEELLPDTRHLTVAGNGEVFLSNSYGMVLRQNLPRTHLTILSNGNLFTQEKWEKLGEFKEIQMMFSVDAASKETYEKVRRGGKWENVMRGLNIASELRRNSEIKCFTIRFVVSRENYTEMPDFVQIGKNLGCDIVDFSRIENWGTFSDEEFKEISMFDGDEPKKEMKEILSHEIMKDPIVAFTNIKVDKD